MIDRDAVLISSMSLLPAILASPVAVATIERAFERQPRWQAILLAALAPAALVGLSLWLTARSTTLGRYGALPPDLIPKALPLMLPAAAALGVLLIGRSFIGKAVVTGIALFLAVGGIAFTALVRNSTYSYQSVIFESDVSTFAWKVPLACAILIGVAAYWVATRRERRHTRARVWTTIAATVFLLWFALRPYQFPSKVSPDQLHSIGGARVTPGGELFITVIIKPVRAAPWVRTAFAVLRPGQTNLTVLSRRPAVNISISGEREPPVSRDGKTLVSVELATPLEAILGRLFRERLIDTVTGRAFFTRLGSRAEAAGGGSLGPRFLGPDHSWATEADGKLTAVLPGGRTVCVDVDRCNSSIWESGSDLRILTLPSQSGIPMKLTTVSLETGFVTENVVGLPYDHSQRVEPSPDGRSFLIEGSPYGRETPWYLVDQELQVSIAGFVPSGSRPVVFWRTGGVVSLIEDAHVRNAIQGVTTTDLSSRGLLIELREVEGVPLALVIRVQHGYRDSLFQLQPSLDAAHLVADRLLSLQWLDDSIVYAQATDQDQRVVRWHPRTGKSEVLLTVPRPRGE